MLDDLDKELNTYAMRLREWYGWHFPELGKIVPDHQMYAKVQPRLVWERVVRGVLGRHGLGRRAAWAGLFFRPRHVV